MAALTLSDILGRNGRQRFNRSLPDGSQPFSNRLPVKCFNSSRPNRYLNRSDGSLFPYRWRKSAGTTLNRIPRMLHWLQPSRTITTNRPTSSTIAVRQRGLLSTRPICQC